MTTTLSPEDQQLIDLVEALTKRDVPCQYYHSGGGCFVVAIYPRGIDFKTSDGQYEYRYLVGNADGLGVFGYDPYDEEGEFIETDDVYSRRFTSTTVEGVADEIVALVSEVIAS